MFQHTKYFMFGSVATSFCIMFSFTFILQYLNIHILSHIMVSYHSTKTQGIQPFYRVNTLIITMTRFHHFFLRLFYLVSVHFQGANPTSEPRLNLKSKLFNALGINTASSPHQQCTLALDSLELLRPSSPTDQQAVFQSFQTKRPQSAKEIWDNHRARQADLLKIIGLA